MKKITKCAALALAMSAVLFGCAQPTTPDTTKTKEKTPEELEAEKLDAFETQLIETVKGANVYTSGSAESSWTESGTIDKDSTKKGTFVINANASNKIAVDYAITTRMEDTTEDTLFITITKVNPDSPNAVMPGDYFAIFNNESKVLIIYDFDIKPLMAIAPSTISMDTIQTDNLDPMKILLVLFNKVAENDKLYEYTLDEENSLKKYATSDNQISINNDSSKSGTMTKGNSTVTYKLSSGKFAPTINFDSNLSESNVKLGDYNYNCMPFTNDTETCYFIYLSNDENKETILIGPDGFEGIEWYI